ncbi:unnamed protein product, partial [Aureobasidium pullulans]|uniref:Uncharacterized protein n=1 Tax=Aureobasidium pullulans EXF-150 TaxID=1043002 RepID=A0A074X622_AURPU
MDRKHFRSLIPSTPTQVFSKPDLITFFIKDAFSLPTLLSIGALLQSLLILVFPIRVALLPLILLSTYTVLTTAIASANPRTYGYMQDIHLGRTSAQLPNPQTGKFGNVPADQAIVVFHFGVRFSHPLGIFSPGAQKTISHFTKCNDLVLAKASAYGLLGLSPWRAAERGSNNTLMMVYYFRNVEGLNKFAHDPIHRRAWEWIQREGGKHVGFFHEAFVTPRGGYESIYVNLQPLLMGAARVECVVTGGDDGGDGEGQGEGTRGKSWVSTLVSADTPSLKSQFGRMGREVAKKSGE